MKLKSFVALILMVTLAGSPAIAQKSFFKSVGKEVTKGVKKIKKGYSSNSKSKNAKSKESATVNRDPNDVCRDVILIEELQTNALVAGDNLIYFINKKNSTAQTRGPINELKGYLKRACVHAYVEFNGKTYPVTSINSGAFDSESLTSVIIPSGVTEIQNNAFSSSALRTVTIPGSVQRLKPNCFAKSNLKSVVLEEGVKHLEGSVFSLCNHLVEAQFPSTLQHMDVNTFEYCKSLQKVTFASNCKLKRIGNRAFYECKKLTTIELPENLEEIGERAFAYSGLKSITIHENIKKICKSAFEGTQIQEITIPASVEEIEEDAFSDCKNLKKINISSKFKDFMLLHEIFGFESTHIFTDYDINKCPIFNWID